MGWVWAQVASAVKQEKNPRNLRNRKSRMRGRGDICVIGANGNVVECMYMGGNGRNGRLGSPSKTSKCPFL